jgi:hypothetical protein
MAYPSDVLRWSDDDPATTRDEPSEGEKDTGWTANEVPTSGIMNWLIGVPGDWIAWLKGAIDDGFEYALKPSADNTQALGEASARWENVYGKNIYGTNYRLDADYGSVICVSLGTGHPTEFGGAGWQRTCGTTPDTWVSLGASKNLIFDVQVPQGAKVTHILVDWQAHAASPGTKMRFSAQRHLVYLPGTDGESFSAEDYDELLSTTWVSAQASTSRKWALMTTDQNNVGFDNTPPGPKRLRIRIESSTEAGADIVYGVYVACTHRSVGHLSPAPAVT